MYRALMWSNDQQTQGNMSAGIRRSRTASCSTNTTYLATSKGTHRSLRQAVNLAALRAQAPPSLPSSTRVDMVDSL
jgi:hypothetical protein